MTKFSKIVVNVPDIIRTYVYGSENYSKTNIINGNIATINLIKSNYSTSIDHWGKVFEIDTEIIIAFIATESSGINRLPKSKLGPNGLMQVSVAPIAEAIFKFVQITKKELPYEAINVLNKKSSFLTKLDSDILTSAQGTQISNLLQQPDYNIMAGCLVLRWLLEKFKYLNKTIVAYNAGAYTPSLKQYGLAPATTTQLLANKEIKTETKAYLLKMLGVNGFLDLIIAQNKLK